MVMRAGSRSKVSDAQLIAAYEKHQNVWRAGAAIGLAGQTVHGRLTALGVDLQNPRFSDEDRARLRREYDAYADAGRLDELAAAMGRTRQFVCRQAGLLGLTDPSRKRPYVDAAHLVAILNTNHPRGMQGKQHTTETKRKMRASKLGALKKREAAGTLVMPRPNASWQAGWRDVGGVRIYFRSRWEANYARYLQWLKERGSIIAWEHEPETFWFEAIRRGTRSYLPDFRVTEGSGAIIYHEVKGWMDKRSRTKIKRMRIYHPNVKLLVIDRHQYRAISVKVAGLVPGWESGKADQHFVREKGCLI